MNKIRWLLALVSPTSGFAVTVTAAIVLTNILEKLCPPELMISGLCTASWFPAAVKAAFATASFIGALVFVALPALAAPTFKSTVAWAAFGAGLTVAVIFLWQGGKDILPSFVAAILGGLLGVFRTSRESPNAA